MKGRKKREGGGANLVLSLASGNGSLCHPWTLHLFSSMYYNWVIDFLWATTIHVSHCTLPTGYSSNHPWQVFWLASHYVEWLSSSQCYQVKLFVIPICSREVILCHPCVVLLTFRVVCPWINCDRFVFSLHTIDQYQFSVNWWGIWQFPPSTDIFFSNPSPN